MAWTDEDVKRIQEKFPECNVSLNADDNCIYISNSRDITPEQRIVMTDKWFEVTALNWTDKVTFTLIPESAQTLKLASEAAQKHGLKLAEVIPNYSYCVEKEGGNDD